MELKSGLLQEKPKLFDWEVGSSPITFEIKNPDGDWTYWLPIVEEQNRWGYDRMACVSYSYLNCIETLWKFQNNGVEWNFSDRFLAKMSGTDHSGNTLSKVVDTARNFGLVDENLWMDVPGGWDEYYKEIPQEIKNEALEFKKDWLLYREWVVGGVEDMFLALKMSPLQVTLKYANGNGILNPAGIPDHAVMVFNASKGEYWHIFDHYTQSIKKYAWNYPFGAVLKPSLIKKTNNNIMLTNNTLVQLVQGKGEFGLYLDDKIIVDDLAKILAVWNVRNNGDIKGKVKPLTLEQWEKYQKVNLKGDII